MLLNYFTSMHVIVFVGKRVLLVGCPREFVGDLVGVDLLFHLPQNEFNIIVSLYCSLIVLIDENVLDQIV